jgi:hypothetical protein
VLARLYFKPVAAICLVLYSPDLLKLGVTAAVHGLVLLLSPGTVVANIGI